MKNILLLSIFSISSALAGGYEMNHNHNHNHNHEKVASPISLEAKQDNIATETAKASNIEVVAKTLTCDNMNLDIKYIHVNQASLFVTVKLKGQEYGLTEAVTGSGARWVGNTAPEMEGGLEWIEHKGTGTLNLFHIANPEHSVTLANCKL